MRCLSCKYDLRNLPENRCPECGREFDPNDPRTFEAELSRSEARQVRLINWVVLIVCALLIAIAFAAALFALWYNPTNS